MKGREIYWTSHSFGWRRIVKFRVESTGASARTRSTLRISACLLHCILCGAVERDGALVSMCTITSDHTERRPPWVETQLTASKSGSRADRGENDAKRRTASCVRGAPENVGEPIRAETVSAASPPAFPD